jgi:hypothetical protein
MSETPSKRQIGIKKHAGAQVGSVEANSPTPGNRSLQAGGEFLKALASDLAAVASQLKRSLIARHRRTPPPRASAPSPVSQRPTIGRMLWRLSVALLAVVTICAGALSAVTLWVLFGSPLEPRRSDAGTPGLSFEARKGQSLKGESLGRIGPLKAGDASRQDLAREAGEQGRSGSSSADAAEQKAAKETQTEAGAGADQPQLLQTEPQDRRPAAGQQESSRAQQEGSRAQQESSRAQQESSRAQQESSRAQQESSRAQQESSRAQQESSRTLTDSRPRMQCNVDLCAARYASFHAADCTYQPHGGGPRGICELGARSADARPQTSRAATDSSSEAKDTRVVERAPEVPKSTIPARPAGQCNVDVCAATYASFHAADCTYQPHGGGPRSICQQ